MSVQSLQNTARRLLTKYGVSIQCSRDNHGDFDVLTGQVGDVVDSSYVGVGYPSAYRDSQIDGTLIKRGDIYLIFRTSTEPKLNDVATVLGIKYTMLNIQNVTISGSNIIYKIQLRQ